MRAEAAATMPERQRELHFLFVVNVLNVCNFHIRFTHDGAACGAICDRQGRHLLCCPSGGGYFVGHDNVCATYCLLAAGTEGVLASGCRDSWNWL